MLQQHAHGTQQQQIRERDNAGHGAHALQCCHWRSVLSKEKGLQVSFESLFGCRATFSQGDHGQNVPQFWCSTGKDTNPKVNFYVSLINTQTLVYLCSIWCSLLVVFQISLLLFMLLYVSSYITICQFRRRADSEDMYAGQLLSSFTFMVNFD